MGIDKQRIPERLRTRGRHAAATAIAGVGAAQGGPDPSPRAGVGEKGRDAVSPWTLAYGSTLAVPSIPQDQPCVLVQSNFICSQLPNSEVPPPPPPLFFFTKVKKGKSLVSPKHGVYPRPRTAGEEHGAHTPQNAHQADPRSGPTSRPHSRQLANHP